MGAGKGQVKRVNVVGDISAGVANNKTVSWDNYYDMIDKYNPRFYVNAKAKHSQASMNIFSYYLDGYDNMQVDELDKFSFVITEFIKDCIPNALTVMDDQNLRFNTKKMIEIREMTRVIDIEKIEARVVRSHPLETELYYGDVYLGRTIGGSSEDRQIVSQVDLDTRRKNPPMDSYTNSLVRRFFEGLRMDQVRARLVN